MTRRQGHQQGFTFLELVLVVLIIAVLAGSGVVYYQNALKDARRLGVELLAHRFTAVIALTHGKWIVQGGYAEARKGLVSQVKVENTDIYLNEFGWPANTDGSSTLSSDQTAEECYQIWQAVQQNPALATVEGRDPSPNDSDETSSNVQQRYHISQIPGGICRYELVTEVAGTHYFDYNLQTGQVLITVPPLD